MSEFKTKAFKLRHFYYSKTLSNLIDKTFKLIKLTKRILYFFKDCSPCSYFYLKKIKRTSLLFLEQLEKTNLVFKGFPCKGKLGLEALASKLRDLGRISIKQKFAYGGL